MHAAKVEPAWQTFLANDVSVLTALALDYVDLDEHDLDNDEFRALQQQTFTGTEAEKNAAADALVKYGEAIGSSHAWDGVVARAFDGVKRYADALEARRRALLLAPTWHPQEAPRVVGNVGYDLQMLGELDAAIVWYERALAWDVENPYVLSSLAEIAFDRGDFASCVARRERLAALGYPHALTEELDAKLRARGLGPTGRPDPGLGVERLGRLTPALFHRATTCMQFAVTQSPIENARNHVLACLLLGRFDYALFAGDLARLVATSDDTDSAWTRAVAAVPARVANEQALRAVLAAKPDVFARDFEARARATDALAQRGDAETLEGMLFDPHPFVRLRAARALAVDMGRDVSSYLGEVAAMERKKNVDVRSPGDFGVSALDIQRLARRKQLPPQPLSVVPEEGIDHPVFDRVEKNEAISIMLSFRDPPSPDDAKRFGVAIHDAVTKTSWDAFGGKLEPGFEGDGRAFHILLEKRGKLFGGGPTQPREPVRAIVQAALATGLPIFEVYLARMRSESGGAYHCVDDPRVQSRDYDDEEQWFRASLDGAAVPPPPVPEGGTSFMMLPRGDGHVAERSTMTPLLSGLRVVYGLVDDVEDRPRDARADQLRDAVREALTRAFRGEPPRFVNKHGVDDDVAPVSYGTRRGYAFAVPGLVAEFIAHYPSSARFREYELFVAMREAVHRVGLVPVVQWARSGGVWIVNVWESG